MSENKVYKIEGKKLTFDRDAFENGYDLLEALEVNDSMVADFEWVDSFVRADDGESMYTHSVIRHRDTGNLYMLDCWTSSNDGMDLNYSDWHEWALARSKMVVTYVYS